MASFQREAGRNGLDRIDTAISNKNRFRARWNAELREFEVLKKRKKLGEWNSNIEVVDDDKGLENVAWYAAERSNDDRSGLLVELCTVSIVATEEWRCLR